MKTFTKKYQVWGTIEGHFAFQEFDTLQECIIADKGSSEWYITKRVNLNVTDAEEQPTPYARPTTQPTSVKPSEPDPAEELAAKYAAGPIGNLGL